MNVWQVLYSAFTVWLEKHDKFEKWYIVDVDNYLKGNPHIKKKKDEDDAYDKIEKVMDTINTNV